MTVFPYIARTDAELYVVRQLTVTGGRLAYADERPHDRDEQGVLWERQVMAHQVGKPIFGKIHIARQRHASLCLLCQVCGLDPDENDDGILWLLPGPVDAGARSSPDRLVLYPPICQPCCDKALRMCPPLREGHEVLRVGSVEPAGVLGILHDADAQPVSGEMPFRYGHPDLPMVLAVQQMLLLNDVTTVFAQ